MPLPTKNGRAVALADLPCVTPDAFATQCIEHCNAGARLSALLVVPAAPSPDRELLAVLSDDARGELSLLRTVVPPDGRVPSLTANLPQAQAFEREILEDHGIVPEGHPWPKPLRAHAELDGAARAHPFFRVDGAGIHEVAVGPVHAGIIEPGHFRFQCHGETVLHLEIHLGYQRRGAEALLLRSKPARRLVIAESIAGDTAIGHALAYCAAIEALSGAAPPPLAEAVRALALEIERIANHLGDLGALCNDIAYLPGASWFGRLRGELLNLLLDLSGNRFGRSLVVPGGVRFQPSARQRADFAARLARVERDLEATAQLTFDAPSVLSRFERTGVVPRALADALGLVGPAARASGCPRDIRRDHPWGHYTTAAPPLAVAQDGDVMARAMIRYREAQHALALSRRLLDDLPGGPTATDLPPPRPNALAVTLIEGWRGEIAHIAVTGEDGALIAYKIVDPSFHNWFGLAMALRDEEISDFPLCNKSFNLSYAGHDL